MTVINHRGQNTGARPWMHSVEELRAGSADSAARKYRETYGYDSDNPYIGGSQPTDKDEKY